MSDLWIQTDSGKDGGLFLINADTRKAPIASEGNRLDLYVGAFRFDQPENLSSFERINLLIKDSQTADDATTLADIDVLIGAINTAEISLTDWNAKTDYNLLFTVPSANLAYDLGTAAEKEMWMAITAFNDTSGIEKTLGAGKLTLREDNNNPPSGLTYMLKSVYDVNNDGIVDRAAVADSVAWSDISGKPTILSDLTGAVRYDAVQSLSGPEQSQARSNISAVTSTEVDSNIAGKAVRYDASQGLSAGEQAQGRSNIGALSDAEITTSIDGKAVRYDAAQTLSTGEKAQARANMGVADSLSGAVLYNAVQSLSSGEQAQARTNIGALGSTDLTGAVRYDAIQSLTADEKTQARDNIGASASAEAVEEFVVRHAKELTTIEGATSECLQDIDASAITLTKPVVYAFKEAATGLFRFYELVLGDGTEVHSSPDVILPNNYDDPLRLQYWSLLTMSDIGTALLADGSVAGTARQELGMLNLKDATDLEISEGSITVTQGFHYVDVAGATDPTDDLDEILGGTQGDFLVLAPKSGDRTIVIKHGINNVMTFSGSNVSLDAAYKFALFFHDGTNFNLLGVASSGGGGTTNPSLIWDSALTDLVGNDASDLSAIDTTSLTVLEETRILEETDFGLVSYQLQELNLSATTVDSVTFGSNLFTSTAHPFENGMCLRLFSDGTHPGGYNGYTDYYVVNKATNTYQLSLTKGGSVVNMTSSYTGTLKAYRQETPFVVLPNDYDDATNDKGWRMFRTDAMSRVVFQKEFFGESEAPTEAAHHWMVLPADFYPTRLTLESHDAAGNLAAELFINGSSASESCVCNQTTTDTMKYGQLADDWEFDDAMYTQGQVLGLDITDDGAGSATSFGLKATLEGFISPTSYPPSV